WSCASPPEARATATASGCGSPAGWPRRWAAGWPRARTASGPGWAARQPARRPDSVTYVRTDSCTPGGTAPRLKGARGGNQLDIVRLALVDDGGPFGRDVEALLEPASGGAVTVVGRTSDPRAAVDLVRRRRPHVLLLDLGFGAPALAALRDLHRATPVTRIIAMADEADVNVVSAPVLAAASGHCVLPGTVLPSLVGTAVARRPELLQSLTPEDRQLWRMVADG